MSEIILKEESYQAYWNLYGNASGTWNGFKEIVYKDALEYEFKTKQYSLYTGKTI